jgi:hypothetical protein
MLNELGATIRRDRMHMGCIWLEHVDDGIPHFSGRLLSTLRTRYSRLLRSARVTSAPVPGLPNTVSTSQSPKRSRVSTMAGRSSIERGSGITGRVLFLPRRYRLCPWRSAL